MRTRTFGSSPAAQVSVIGQGTWKMEHDPRAAAVAALRRGLELGATHVDTAEMYGSGKAEEIVAEALGNRREEVFLVSKVLPQNASRAGVVAACSASLRRLGTDRLDCYLLHWRGSHPLAETVAGFEDLLRQGKILSWGVSNFDVQDLEELRAVAPRLPACNQVLYHLRERTIEQAVLPWCERHGVAVTAYTPFGTGRFPDVTRAPGDALARIARERDATPRQVALAFLTRHPNVFAIPKTADAAHVEENAGAGRLVLTAQDVAVLDAAFPRRVRSSLPMV